MNQLWRRLTLVKTCRQGGQPKNQPLGMFPFFRNFPGELVGGVGCLFVFFSRILFGEYQLVIHPSAIFQPTWGQRLAMLFDFWRGPSNKWCHEISRPTVHSRIWTNMSQKMICLWENVFIYIYICIRLQNIWFLFRVSILKFSGVLLLQKIVPSWIRWIINYPK